jgi:hypothetical protein
MRIVIRKRLAASHPNVLLLSRGEGTVHRFLAACCCRAGVLGVCDW